MPERFSTFRDFYPFYLTQHQHPVCRALHVAGVLASAATLVSALAVGAWPVAAMAPLVGYAFGWTGHFVFEGNRPASFRQPIFSFLGDLAMARDVLTGRIGLTPQPGYAVIAADKKPALPRELHEKSLVGAALFIGFSTAMWVVPAAAAFWIATAAPWPVWLRALAWLPCCLLAGQGLHLLGWVGHEGFHFNLHRGKRVSAVVGVLFSSMIMSFMQIGASISHKTHHALTNQAGDPDIEIFRRFRGFWSRLFLGRVTCNRIYLHNTVRMLLGRPFPEYWAKPPFRWETMRRLAWLNVATSLAFLALYVAIAWVSPVGALAAIALPHLVGVLYTGLRSYVEHAGTRAGAFTDSRTRTARFFSGWYYFNNYHLEHHLYPSVPCYRLPQVHAWLRAHGHLDRPDVAIEPTVAGAYAYTLGRYQYPEATP